MRNSNLIRLPGAAILALAGHLWAGGFYLQAGNPEASPEARKINAVQTIKAVGCHDPATAKVTAQAIGMVNGERRSIPLKVTAMSEPGTFALARQWPTKGRWVIQLVGHKDAVVTTALLRAGPAGIDLQSWKDEMREFTPAEIEAMLRQ
jgi:hypothetical protein